MREVEEGCSHDGSGGASQNPGLARKPQAQAMDQFMDAADEAFSPGLAYSGQNGRKDLRDSRDHRRLQADQSGILCASFSLHLRAYCTAQRRHPVVNDAVKDLNAVAAFAKYPRLIKRVQVL